jgi:hypothetical protein
MWCKAFPFFGEAPSMLRAFYGLVPVLSFSLFPPVFCELQGATVGKWGVVARSASQGSQNHSQIFNYNRPIRDAVP